MPRISVIIPAFECHETLPLAVMSVLNEECQDSEILIVIDGDCQSTIAAAGRLAKSYPDRVRTFQVPHGGAAAARNAGLDHAQGDYIQFLDADDMLENDKLEHSLQAFEANPDLVCVITRGEVLSRSGTRTRHIMNMEQVYALVRKEPIGVTLSLHTNAPLWRRSHFDTHGLRWSSDLRCWDETEFFIRCFLAVERTDQIKVLDRCHFLRPEIEGHIGSSYLTEQFQENNLTALERIVEAFAAVGAPREPWAESLYLVRRQIMHRVILGGYTRAWHRLAPALRSESLSVATRLLCSLPLGITHPTARMALSTKRALFGYRRAEYTHQELPTAPNLATPKPMPKRHQKSATTPPM